jgi:Flp pilus assembly protein TadB
VKLKSIIATASSGIGALAVAMTGPGALVATAMVLAVVIVTVAICWVVSDNRRARRLNMIIRSIRR